MDEGQIYNLIEKNRCTHIQIREYNGDKLLEISATSPTAAVKELEDELRNFSEYRKLEILGKTKDTATWSNGFKWKLEYTDRTNGKDKKEIAGTRDDGRIGSMEFISFAKDSMQKNFDLQIALMESKMAQQNNDPTKWIPVFQAVAPSLGLAVANTGIAGPQTKQLVFSDVSQLTDAEINTKIDSVMESMSKKMKGSQMLMILQALDSVPNLTAETNNIILLMQGLAKNPALIQQAIKFV